MSNKTNNTYIELCQNFKNSTLYIYHQESEKIQKMGKMFSNCIFYKELVSKVYKEKFQINNKKTKIKHFF